MLDVRWLARAGARGRRVVKTVLWVGHFGPVWCGAAGGAMGLAMALTWAGRPLPGAWLAVLWLLLLAVIGVSLTHALSPYGRCARCGRGW